VKSTICEALSYVIFSSLLSLPLPFVQIFSLPPCPWTPSSQFPSLNVTDKVPYPWKAKAECNLYDAIKTAPNSIVVQIAGHSGWGLWFCSVSSVDLAVTTSFPPFLSWIPDVHFGAEYYLWLYEKMLTAKGQYIISHIVLVTGFKIRYTNHSD